RVRFLADRDMGSYVDREEIAREVRDSRRLFAKHGWPVIDVTRRSIEETAATIIKLYTDRQDTSGVNVVTKGDSRVTNVGRFIRKTSIDELPQLFNVLLGTLSLVGPRPHVANAQTDNKLWTEVVDSYIARHRVKPGVTGWAQVNGWRGEIDQEEKLQGRVEHDLYYIENWSLMFDIYILAITPFKILNTENAY
ncbi:MAG: sugar transferase, partial [Pseudomonadota bacterium]